MLIKLETSHACLSVDCVFLLLNSHSSQKKHTYLKNCCAFTIK